MSKKWLNPPLSLQLRRETTNHLNEDEGLPQSIQSDSHDTATLSSIARRESSTSVAQYAFVAPSGNYLDLPSAVPFQDSFTPALPSAEFPSSARGFVTPPVTSSTADFPGATHSGHTSIVAAYQHSHLSYNNTSNAISDGRDSFGEEQHQRASNPAIHGDRTTSPASSDPMTIPPQTSNTETTSGATALNRADSSVSYNSVWTIRGEDGSIPRLALDITQFPRPPAQAKASDHASTTDTIPSRETSLDDPYDLSSSGRTMAFPGHPLVLKPGVLRSMARSFNAPTSPLFEESEPSSSRPLTPIAVGGVSYKYPIAIGDDPPQRLAGSSPLVRNSISLPLSQGQSQARENPEEYHAPVQYLAPPVPASPGAASARDSSQSMVSQLTVASRGSTTSPHLSFVGDRPARASNLPTPNESAPGQWDQVLSSVKAHWNSSDSVVADPNRQTSSAGAGNTRSRFVSSVATSAAVAGSISNNDNEEGDNTGETVTVPATLNPGAPSTALSPLSGESNSDVYSAIGRMSFPKPPFGVESNASSSPSSISPLNEAAAPITALSGSTQSPNRTPRSTWVTGLTLRTRSSRGSLKRRATEDSPLTSPKTPIVPPLPAAVVVEPVTNAGSSQGHTTEESVAESKAQELTVPSLRPDDNNSLRTSVEAPSYKRRVSDLMRAAIEPTTRESLASSIITTTDSSRNSLDGAVVGVARTASLSARAKALLTRGPSIHTVNQESTTLSYLVPSPLPSAQVSHTSLGGEPSIITQVTPLGSEADDASHHRIETTAPLTLRRPPPIRDVSTFPESVGSAKSSTDGMGEEIILQRIQSRDAPHSAFPLNQSTPFRDYFSPAVPTSLRNQQSTDTSYQEPVIIHSRNQSKSRNIRMSVMSSISDASARAAKTMSWFRKKPLPDVPYASTSGLGREKQVGRGQDEKHSDEDLTVLDLAKRAIEMDQYLTVGELPYANAPGAGSNYRHPYANGEGAVGGTVERVNTVRHKANPVRMSLPSAISSLSDLANRRNFRTIGFSQLQEGRKQPNLPQRQQDEENGEAKLKSNRKRRTMIVVLVFICVSAFLIPIGIIFGRKARRTESGAEICDDGVMTGASCQLNSTCVCTSSVAGRCDPVAQALLDLVPLTNTQFGMNMTNSNLALALWDIQGQPTDNCASQAVLVDVAPAMNRTTSPTRTDWARAAILYNLLRSYDLSTSEAFRKSISSADLTSLQGSDQPVTNDATAIQFQSSGFVYDLAAMTFAPTSVDWKENSGVSQEQTERVNVVVDRVLDRMYSFATASSIQRSTALSHYWTDVLGLPESNLSNFAAALGKSPILLPFEATSPAIAAFLSNTTSNNGISLPAPVSCLPALSDVQRHNVDLIEQSSFGLAALGSSPSSVEASCFPDRPVYGILDVLRLRRPFGDSRTSMRIPAAGLVSQAYSRVIVHSGEQLVGISGFNDQGVASSSNFTALSADPREYGTLGHLNHIALTYLQAFPTLDLAKRAALFILDAQDDTAPPSSGNALFDQTDGFTEIPTLEVAVFGSILPTDVEVFHADLATPNGTLFFGSENGNIFRRWAIRDDNDVILWSNSSSASQVVRETSSNNTAFENVWNQATEMIKAAAEVGRGTGLPEENAVMQALANASLFS